MSELTRAKLLDKIINLKLFVVGQSADSLISSGETVTLGNGQIANLSAYIQCPKIGRKPTISIKGKILPSPILSGVEIRVTNLFTGQTPLDAYKYIRAECGYSGMLGAPIEGEIANAYQETPGPDGVTVFVMLLGYFTNWNNVFKVQYWPEGTARKTILDWCATELGMTLQYVGSGGKETTDTSYQFSGKVSDFVAQLASSWNVNIYPDGQILKVYPKDSSTGLQYIVEFVTIPPRHEAYGYNLTAPWLPSIRPGDEMVISTKYVRQTYGGANAASSTTIFIANTISFDFSTTEEQNTMTVLAVAAQ